MRKFMPANNTFFNWIDQGVSIIMNTAKGQKSAREAWEAAECRRIGDDGFVIHDAPSDAASDPAVGVTYQQKFGCGTLE